MQNENSAKCSRCGTSDSVDVLFAACIAMTTFSKPGASYIFTKTQDDLRLWQIPLCQVCKPSSYKLYLRNKLGSIMFFFILCAILLVIGVAGSLCLMSQHHSENSGHDLVNNVLESVPKAQSKLATLAAAFGLILGGIGVPLCSVIYLVALVQLKKVEANGKVPAEQMEKCFIGEGQRIIAALISKGGKGSESVWGEFALPELVKFDKDNPPENLRGLKIDERDIEILAVGKTVSEIEQKLPQCWQSHWDRQKQIYGNAT